MSVRVSIGVRAPSPAPSFGVVSVQICYLGLVGDSQTSGTLPQPKCSYQDRRFLGGSARVFQQVNRVGRARGAQSNPEEKLGVQSLEGEFGASQTNPNFPRSSPQPLSQTSFLLVNSSTLTTPLHNSKLPWLSTWNSSVPCYSSTLFGLLVTALITACLGLKGTSVYTSVSPTPLESLGEPRHIDLPFLSLQSQQCSLILIITPDYKMSTMC